MDTLIVSVLIAIKTLGRGELSNRKNDEEWNH